MIYSVHQPSYLPWLGFFDKVAASDVFVFLDEVQYKQREFQNRNKIRTKDGWMWLTVPVTAGQDTRIMDVAVDNARSWPESHLKSLKAWYGRAPYFEKYRTFFEGMYARRWEKLIDLNKEITAFFFEQFGIGTRIYFSSQLGVTGVKTDRIIEIGRRLGADAYLSGAGGRGYLEEGKFADAGIRLFYQDYRHPAYRQQFMAGDKDFIPNLAAVDLLFNEGEKSGEILKGGHSHV